MGPIILSRSFADCRKRAPKRATKVGTRQLEAPCGEYLTDLNLFFNGSRKGRQARTHTWRELRICFRGRRSLVNSRMDSLRTRESVRRSNLIDENNSPRLDIVVPLADSRSQTDAFKTPGSRSRAAVKITCLCAGTARSWSSDHKFGQVRDEISRSETYSAKKDRPGGRPHLTASAAVPLIDTPENRVTLSHLPLPSPSRNLFPLIRTLCTLIRALIRTAGISINPS